MHQPPKPTPRPPKKKERRKNIHRNGPITVTIQPLSHFFLTSRASSPGARHPDIQHLNIPRPTLAPPWLLLCSSFIRSRHSSSSCRLSNGKWKGRFARLAPTVWSCLGSLPRGSQTNPSKPAPLRPSPSQVASLPIPRFAPAAHGERTSRCIYLSAWYIN